MTEDEIEARRAHLLTQEMESGKASVWWLSFCDPVMPEGERFVGVSLVRAPGLMFAASVAHALGCNPGGEVLGLEIPEPLAARVPYSFLNRLVRGREAVEAFDAELNAELNG